MFSENYHQNKTPSPTKPAVTKLTINPKTVTATPSAIGKQTVQFVPKITTNSPIKAATSIQKPTPTIIAIDVQDDKEVAIVVEDNEVALLEDEIGSLFQDTSSEDELGNEWLETNLQALQKEPSSLLKPANLMHILICEQANANFQVKISGVDVTALYDTSTNMKLYAICMIYEIKWSTTDTNDICCVSALSYGSWFMPHLLMYCEVTLVRS